MSVTITALEAENIKRIKAVALTPSPTGRRSGPQLLNAFIEPLALDLPRFMEATNKEKAGIQTQPTKSWTRGAF